MPLLLPRMPQLGKHGLGKRGSGAKFTTLIAAITLHDTNFGHIAHYCAMSQEDGNVGPLWTFYIKVIHMDVTSAIFLQKNVRSTMTAQVLQQFAHLPFTCGSAAARAFGLASAGCQT